MTATLVDWWDGVWVYSPRWKVSHKIRPGSSRSGLTASAMCGLTVTVVVPDLEREPVGVERCPRCMEEL